MMIDELPELATPHDVAKVLGCSERFVQTECAAGNIRCFRIASKYRIDGPEAVRDYLEAQRVTACQKKTGGPTSTGEKTEANGLSDGSKAVANARRQQAVDAASALKRKPRSGGTSSKSKRNKTAPVVQLTGSLTTS